MNVRSDGQRSPHFCARVSIAEGTTSLERHIVAAAEAPGNDTRGGVGGGGGLRVMRRALLFTAVLTHSALLRRRRERGRGRGDGPRLYYVARSAWA